MSHVRAHVLGPNQTSPQLLSVAATAALDCPLRLKLLALAQDATDYGLPPHTRRPPGNLLNTFLDPFL